MCGHSQYVLVLSVYVRMYPSMHGCVLYVCVKSFLWSILSVKLPWGEDTVPAVKS